LGIGKRWRVLSEGMSVAEAIAECQLRTRHYAKRQITWFRAEKELRWVNGFGGDEAVQEEAAEMVRSFLR
jgi:tRNA dimethylallyltransferase